MGLLKDHLIGVREELEKTYNISLCHKCGGKGYYEVEIMGGSASDEWGVVDVKIVQCDECF